MSQDIAILSLLEYLENELRGASSLPLSSKKIIDAGKCLDLIEEMRTRLPDDIRRAQRVVDEQDNIREQAEQMAKQQMGYAESRAQQILADARAEAEELVSESEVLKEAEARAAALLDDAQAEADRMLDEAERNAESVRQETLDYADGILARVEIRLDEALNQVIRTRQEIDGTR